MDPDEARARAAEYVEQLARETGHDLMLRPGPSERFSCGWVFHFNTRDHFEKGRIGVVGQGPLLVDDRDGSIHTTGSNISYVNFVLAEYGRRWADGPPTPGLFPSTGISLADYVTAMGGTRRWRAARAQQARQRAMDPQPQRPYSPRPSAPPKGGVPRWEVLLRIGLVSFAVFLLVYVLLRRGGVP
jgi:hypothetical protein